MVLVLHQNCFYWNLNVALILHLRSERMEGRERKWIREGERMWIRRKCDKTKGMRGK